MELRDLAPDKGFILRLAETDRDIGLPLRQVQKPVADNQLDLQAGMAGVKRVDQSRTP